jgi:transcriptional regulator with XRE-family HTH domain
MATVGDRIRERRTKLGWTQDDLASKAGLSKGFLSDVENNKRNVGADSLLDLAEALNVSLDYLMKGEMVRAKEKTLEIPADLAEFASQAGISFRDARQLLGMQQQILAHRSAGKAGAAERFDWAHFYESVKKFLK